MVTSHGVRRGRALGLAVAGGAFIAGVIAGVAGARLAPAEDAAGVPVAIEADTSALRNLPEGPPDRSPVRRSPVLRSLDLSETQKERIDSILARGELRMKELWGQHEASYRATRDATRDEVFEVLTPEQREEYVGKVEEMRRRWREREEREESGERDGRTGEKVDRERGNAGSSREARAPLHEPPFRTSPLSLPPPPSPGSR